jgi:hypothetical protein
VVELEQELNGRAYNVIWVEERSFVFDCIVRVLRFTVATEDDPLALLAMALLFHNLGESEYCNAALSRVEDTLHTLPDILDSGLQLRDCLVASGYYYVARKAYRGMLTVDHIVLRRINFAAASEWFDDPCLAAIVALISDEVQVGSDARRYLRDRINAWLNNDYVLGMLLYCLAEDEQLSDQLTDYLLKRDWSDDAITTLTWGLLVLGRLRKKGYEIHQPQYVIAQRILGILGNSDLVQAIVAEKPDPNSLNTGSLTSFDLAFAACALAAEGFDSVIGVHRNQQAALNALLNLRHTLVQGGRVVSRSWLVVFQVSLVGFLSLVLWELLRLTGIGAMLQVLVEITLVALLSAAGMGLFKKGSPSIGAARAIFGDAVLQDDAGGEDYGREN